MSRSSEAAKVVLLRVPEVPEERSSMRYRCPALWLLFTMSLAGCGMVDGGTRVEGPAPTAVPWTGPVYVDDARSIPRRRPDIVDLTEHTTLYGLKWRGWGTSRAVATGVVVDVACASGCPQGDADPPTHPVRLVLSGLVKREYAAYYDHAVLTPAHPPTPNWVLETGDLSLQVPAA
ncbi:hypothetical protein ACIQPR_45570 [Streptomyces sp. NPDC091280]|uniref:hypothetical protein n=1 Tax=Streptomyces sp. NPDC091280 TaxID=3365984 RepID=UPI00382C29D6